MIPDRVATAPGSGICAHRTKAALIGSLIAAIIATLPANARKPSPAVAPRIAYPDLPVDDRIAPDDFAARENVADSAAQRALAQLSQNYRPNPAIWKIADQDTTIYLFGTVHVLPPGFEWRTAALERIVARADTLLIESIDDGAGVDRLIDGRARARSSHRLAPLAGRVSRDHRDLLARFLATLPPPAAALLDTLPTWIASIAISFVREVRAGEQPGPGADDWIEAQFRAARKPVIPIENGSAVLARVNAIPEADQRRMLDAALDAPDRTRAELRAPVHAWAKGDVGPDSLLTIDLTAMSGSSALTGPLLDDRNRAWTDALIRRLERPGTMLFAAGAGHFIGNGSVIELLGRRGIEVSRVQ